MTSLNFDHFCGVELYTGVLHQLNVVQIGNTVYLKSVLILVKGSGKIKKFLKL